jgi:hypothetical protein
MKLYEAIARKTNASLNADDIHWSETFRDEAGALLEYLPHGSGIDGTTEINWSKTKDQRLVISSSYHVMTDGYYVRLINFNITITPDLRWGMNLKITGNFGRDQNIKNSLEDTFDCAFNQVIQ